MCGYYDPTTNMETTDIYVLDGRIALWCQSQQQPWGISYIKQGYRSQTIAFKVAQIQWDTFWDKDLGQPDNYYIKGRLLRQARNGMTTSAECMQHQESVNYQQMEMHGKML